MTSRNIRLLIAYDGSCYCGWQRQANASTVQGTIEDRLAVMTGGEPVLHGAGRTDAGVHAAGMVANFTTDSSIPCPAFMNGLNSMLPRDIRILKAEEAAGDFHSRYSATGKTYGYRAFTGRVQLPTERLYTAHYPCDFDEEAAKKALQIIRGTHDFTSFEGSGSRDTSREGGRGAVRTLFMVGLEPLDSSPDTWLFTFTGDGFLRHMVRNLVGTLMEVGSRKISPGDFDAVLRTRDRSCAGPTAPACGLTLKKVHYRRFDL